MRPMNQESKDLIEKVQKYGAHNYHPLSVVLREGHGASVKDVEGKEYIDFLSCYSALNFGHQNPKIIAALKTQLDKLAVCSRAFYSEELSYFCEELAKFAQMESVLTMNSGAEACETAIKVARKWGYQKKGVAADQANIIVMENNFHGRTVALISFSTEPIYRDDFGPFAPGFRLVPYGDSAKLEAAIDKNTVGVLLEPIQAEAGILRPPAGYLKTVREICDRNRVLMMVDEIQTGLGRTGRDFCFQHDGISVDMIILGKSLGGGVLPLSAVVAKKEVMDVIRPGEHGSTFGGNPLACAVGRAAIRLLQDEKLSARAARLGDLVMQRLSLVRSPLVKEVRGLGLLIGIELHPSAGGARVYCEKLATQGVLCKETHDHVIRIAPPLTIDEATLMEGLERVIKVISTS